MSPFTSPKIAAIDDALTELEPTLEEFGRSQRFALTRSHEGSFNIPRRWLHRELAGIRHEIGLIVASPMPERLERGFWPDIPCTLYLSACGGDGAMQRHYHTAIVEAQPFRLFKDSLSRHLAAALAKRDRCTPEFIARYGVYDEKG